MNNMLYIIVALIVILMVGVWVLRKNKAQPPRVQSPIKDSQGAATPKPMTANVGNTGTKFDDVTVAQRFIDQQRYDKAIETLQRGLIEKPNDSALLLKLLNVYALSDQKEAFYKTYADITAQADMATIAQARQLKELLDNDTDPVPSFGNTTASSGGLETNTASSHPIFDLENTPVPTPSTDIIQQDNDNDMSLDFELSDSSLTPSSSPVVEQSTKKNDTTANSTFDLTLDDLETSDFEQNDFQDSPVTSIDNDTITLTPDTALETEPLTLDFDTSEQPDTLSFAENTVAPTNSSDDDFVLDFDHLLEDSDESLTADIEADDINTNDVSDDAFALDFDMASSTAEPVTEPKSATLDDDFTLFLNEATIDADEADSNAVILDDFALDTKSNLEAPVASPNNNQNDHDILNTNFLEDTLLDNGVDGSVTIDEIDSSTPLPANANEASDFDFNIETEIETENNVTAATPTLEDNNNSFDATADDYIDLDLESNVDIEPVETLITTPVITEDHPVALDDSQDLYNSDSANINETGNDIPKVHDDFDAQFAEDFDFVNTLDSHQITLDLASQYLQLGEYDSAKRLLNEVITQGNIEQQKQAKALLTRTA